MPLVIFSEACAQLEYRPVHSKHNSPIALYGLAVSVILPEMLIYDAMHRIHMLCLHRI
jgi:hypothetical protein